MKWIFIAIVQSYLIPFKFDTLQDLGDNIVQGYGQKICLESAILDFPGRNLQQTPKSYPYIIFNSDLYLTYNVLKEPNASGWGKSLFAAYSIHRIMGIYCAKYSGGGGGGVVSRVRANKTKRTFYEAYIWPKKVPMAAKLEGGGVKPQKKNSFAASLN